jgi:gluconolactonase
MTDLREITAGLLFPEGPIAMPDGSVILVEIERGTLSRVTPDGNIEVVAEPGGGPNGAALGPDGKVYVCNNGGFNWTVENGIRRPISQASDYTSGRIERIDIESGAVEVLYDSCDGHPLRGPNDIVFDKSGGFWFTDLGKARARDRDHGGLYYAKADGSMIIEAVYPLLTPNGVGLSPDESRVYAAETEPLRLLAWDIVGEGEVSLKPWPAPGFGDLVMAPQGYARFDSLALDAEGNICVATLINGGITVSSPDGATVEHIPMPDPMCTNICFGGENLQTAFITLSGTGRLVAMDWPTPGLPLNFLNT